MDNYGNEINQKMRSAVKAKLVELGTGGSAGYIDDELPDYVMIMVANKRSKQQMISDLNLFLGSQTELFVTWLHEVLQKLQEVTLPSANAPTRKRKSSQKEDSSAASCTMVAKKDKKQAKKDKASTSKKPKDSNSTTPEKTSSSKVVSSITDLVAEELLEKAKQNITATVDATQNIKKSKHKRASEELTNFPNSPGDQQNEIQGFDIPTISEISSTTGVETNTDSTKEASILTGNREQDLAELEEIQKKIYAAKKQLKQIGELEDDEDFLNLRDEDSREEFNEAGDLIRKTTPPQDLQGNREKSPIVFEREKTRHHYEDQNEHEILASKRKHFTPPPQLTSAATASDNNTSSKDDNADFRNEKRSVHQRLGIKNPGSTRESSRSSQPLPRERRKNLQEQELYVPAFRRKEMERERERERERDQERSRDRERDQYNRDRGRERDSDRRSERQRESEHNNLTRGRPRVRRSFEDRDKRRSTSENNNEERNSSQVGKISTTTPSSANRTRSSSNDASPDIIATRKRIGSRVIVAPAKPPELSDDGDLNDKPVNSVIKIKPRPPVSPSRQAPKNLLLRAVAEAQRSTVLKKPSTNTKSKVALRLGEKINNQRNTKLYSKSYRDRLKTTTTTTATTGVGALFTRTTKNLIVEVNGRLAKATNKSSSSSYINPQEDEEYIPESVSDKGESDQDYLYVPQSIQQPASMEEEDDNDNTNDSSTTYNRRDHTNEEEDIKDSLHKTQFVVTLNEEKALPKLKRHAAASRYSRSLSPPPQVSSSSNSKDREKYAEPTSTSNPSTNSRKNNIKERLLIKSSSSNERRSSLRQETSTTPPPRRTELIEIYRKPKEIKKIIIKNDSEDDDLSPSKKHSPEKDRKLKRRSHDSPTSCDRDAKSAEKRSTTPPFKDHDHDHHHHNDDRHNDSLTPSKRKHILIKFDLHESKESRNSRDSPIPSKKRRSLSHETLGRDRERDSRDHSRDRDRERASSHGRREEKRKISIRNEAKKYDNIPASLNAVPVDSSNAFRTSKPKERCKYHPNCTKSFCEFYHPTSTCKSFPLCKFADKCLYSHPKCKYDLACVNLDCNFSHSGPRSASLLEPTAPPISSSVVPVQNYKSISSTTVTGPVSSTTCKFFPNCTKTSCPFYHPKSCRYGKNCINKIECLFYHHEIPSSSKFKWIAQGN